MTPKVGPFRFSQASLAQRETLHPDLQRVLDLAIQDVDFTIIEGHRGKAKQDAAVANNKSQTPWPTSKHNASPSYAVDVMPYPVDWSDNVKNLTRIAFMMGVIHAAGRALHVPLRFGMDFNRNMDPRDESFLDWDHVELDRPVAPEDIPKG